MEETKYNKGDVVIINNIDWTIREIRMVGWQWVYGLEYETQNGKREMCSIETGSLETLIKLGE
tara:strand:- start:778 stop:966 length:189 start_codon:yes stop_codon:yes gene_type:complete